MTTQESPPTVVGAYLGATGEEMASKTGADMVAAGVSRTVLFHRHGDIELHPDRLALRSWTDPCDLVLRREDISWARARFTEHYGRFVGGPLNSAKPLILMTVPVGELYLLINRRGLLEITDDLKWERLLGAWLAGGG